MRYEYGEDLFGYLFLDVVRGKRNRVERRRTLLFENLRDFICALDIEIGRNENLNYESASFFS